MRVHAMFAGGPADGQITAFHSDEPFAPPESVRVAYAPEEETEKVESWVYFLEDHERLVPIPGTWTAMYGMPIKKESAVSLITVWL